MSNITVTKSSPADYIDNPAVDTRRVNADSATDYRPAVQPRDWRVIAASFAGVAVLLLLVALLYGIFRLTLCWGSYSDTCENWRWIETYFPYVILAAIIIFALAYFAVWFRGALVTIDQRRIENQRFSLLPDRFGNPTPADLYAGLSPEGRFENYYRLLELASDLKAQTAPHEWVPTGVNTLSIGGNSQTVAALPEPAADAIVLTPDDQWRKWLLKAPHLLVAGRTDAGKTTFQTALLGEYIEHGDQVLVLDPHWQPGKWFGLPTTSGVPAILSLLPDLLDELTARLEQYSAGKLTEEFDRLTILIDEVPAIVSECIELSASGRPKITDARWPNFARRLGSEARKVGVRVILGSQSTFVQDVLINPQMRENYTRIGLGNLARTLLGSEPDTKRKQALYDLLRGQSHPAAIEYRGDYHVLDTANVVALAERPMRSLARIWGQSAIVRPEPSHDVLRTLLKAPAVAQSASASATHRASAKTPENAIAQQQTDSRQTEWDQSKKTAVLRAMRQQGITRSDARERFRCCGQGFDNEHWVKAGQ